MATEKKRLDVLIAERGYCPSREKAKREIMAGNVYVDDRLVDKPGTAIEIDSNVDVTRNKTRYVSRGGLKLEKALREFDVVIEGQKVIDIGCSTGGFTDCLLQHGADEVWAVDVGQGQLDWQLRNDARVKVVEGLNARYLTPSDVDPPYDVATVDVSFISLTYILPPLIEVLSSPGEIIALIKPQFEAGREQVEPGGVITDPRVHFRVLDEICSFAREHGLKIRGGTFSPLQGKKSKNIEFFLRFGLGPPSRPVDLTKLVSRAHAELTADSKD